jgi:hypothetical protein
MSEDRIERETLIAAPLERVWSLVAEPGFWVADKASLPGTVASQAVHDNSGGWPQELDALGTRTEQPSV